MLILRALRVLLCSTTLLASAVYAETPNQPPAKKDALSLTIEGDVPPPIAPVVGRMTALFYECFPRLLARFENPQNPAPRSIRLRFERGLSAPAMTERSVIKVNIAWIEQHPEDIGLLTHELTHVVQAYPSPKPGWLTEGIADYARHCYGPASQPGWSLPETLSQGQNYNDGYRVTARFLLWLESTRPGTIDRLNRRMQAGEFREEECEEIAGAPLTQLWRRCVAEIRSDGKPNR